VIDAGRSSFRANDGSDLTALAERIRMRRIAPGETDV
jgi:hypothetical protein